MNKLRPNWPKIHKYIGGGVNGRIFELNDGRYMKIIAYNAPQEWQILQRLQGTHVVPRFKNDNHLTIRFKPETRKEKKKEFGNILNMNNIGNKVTVMIMGRVGGGQAMTLSKYTKKFPFANRRNIHARILHIIDEMHVRGVSHGNLHDENILVTADSAGRIKGMWVIDFGRSKQINLGMTERQHYSQIKSNYSHQTKTLNGNYAFVPVHAGSRMNVNMAKIHHGQNYPENRANKIKNRRLSIEKNLKLLKSPRKISSVRRTKSASPPRRRTIKT
jgi:serine/threonine protein kinase